MLDEIIEYGGVELVHDLLPLSLGDDETRRVVSAAGRVGKQEQVRLGVALKLERPVVRDVREQLEPVAEAEPRGPLFVAACAVRRVVSTADPTAARAESAIPPKFGIADDSMFPSPAGIALAMFPF